MPPAPPKPKPFRERIEEALPHHFSISYIKNNIQFLFFLFVVIFGINIILFIHRAEYFKNFSMLSGYKPNWFYMFSRANGNNKKELQL